MGLFSSAKNTKTIQDLEAGIRREEQKKQADPTWVALAQRQQALDRAVAIREQVIERRAQAWVNHELALNARKEQKESSFHGFFNQALGYSEEYYKIKKEKTKAIWEKFREDVRSVNRDIEPLRLEIDELTSHVARSDIANNIAKFERERENINNTCHNLYGRLFRIVPNRDEIELKNALLRFLETNLEEDAVQLREVLLTSYHPQPGNGKSYGFFQMLTIGNHDTIAQILEETMNLFPELSQPRTYRVEDRLSNIYHP